MTNENYLDDRMNNERTKVLSCVVFPSYKMSNVILRLHYVSGGPGSPVCSKRSVS